MLDLSFIHVSPFYELTALVVLAAVIGFIGVLLRQPMIVSFIAVGVLAGPSALDIVQSQEHVELLAELGIAVLLFLVGLKLDLKLIRTLGPVALATGLGQVAFTSIIGYVLGISLGLDTVTSLYVAVALTFSSTIIIIKLLSDKREVDSLRGRIAVGFLIGDEFHRRITAPIKCHLCRSIAVRRFPGVHHLAVVTQRKRRSRQSWSGNIPAEPLTLTFLMAFTAAALDTIHHSEQLH